MLASPLFPSASFSPGNKPDALSGYRPAKDLEAFNDLLPPPIQFVEGSSTGALAIPEGKYEPINGSPKAAVAEISKVEESSVPVTPHFKRKSSQSEVASLFKGTIDFSWPQGCKIGAGLINTGNSCFLNSVLQCLLHIPPLLRVINGHQQDSCRLKTGFCMTCNLREVAVRSHTSSNPFTPYLITNKLQTIAKHLRRGRQEDSHEFLRYAIDALQKSCLAEHSVPGMDPKLAETTWVHKIFGGRLRSRVTCRECKHNSDTFDSVLDLSLDIFGVNTLKDAFRKFVTVDCLKGADKYKCEKCKRPVVAEKSFTIDKAPSVLTIHLKRFSPLGRKIGHFVKYDEHLNIQSAMSEGQYGPSYSLCGVICHAGGGPHSGHYFAYVKSRSGKWFEMNDETVLPQHSSPVGIKNAYILFYIKEKGQMLEAAVSQSFGRPSSQPKGLANGMKKRKVFDESSSDHGEDKGTKATRPFIGPILPPSSPESNKQPKTTTADPQASTLKKRIEALTKPGDAMKSLMEYQDSSDLDDKGKDDAVTVPQKSSPPQTSRTPRPPMEPVPTSSFYGFSDSNRKRNTLDSDDDMSPSRKSIQNPTPEKFGSSLHGNPKKKSFGLGGPFSSRITTNHFSGIHNIHPRKKYSSKYRRPPFAL